MSYNWREQIGLNQATGWHECWSSEPYHHVPKHPFFADLWRAICERKFIYEVATYDDDGNCTNLFPHFQSMSEKKWLKLAFDFVCQNQIGFVLTYAQGGVTKPALYGADSSRTDQPIMSYTNIQDTVYYYYLSAQGYDPTPQPYNPAQVLNNLCGVNFFPIPTGFDTTTHDFCKIFDMETVYGGESDGVGYVELLKVLKRMLSLQVMIPCEVQGTGDDTYLTKLNDGMCARFGSILDGYTGYDPGLIVTDEILYYVALPGSGSSGTDHRPISRLFVSSEFFDQDGIPQGFINYKIYAETVSGGSMFGTSLKLNFSNLLIYK